MPYLLIPLFSFLASWMIIGGSDFPRTGLALVLAGLATFIYRYQQDKSKYDHLAYGLVLLLSLFFIARASFLESFLDFAAIVYLGSLMINRPWNHETLEELIFAPLHALSRSWRKKTDGQLLYDQLLRKEKNWKGKKAPQQSQQFNVQLNQIGAVLLALFITIVIVPLLASANPIFSRYIERFVDLLPSFDFRTDVYVGRFVIAGILIFFMPKFMSLARLKEQIKTPVRKISFSLIPAKLTLAVILGLFMISQFQLYTASDQIYQQLGITHSERTREVFGQLSVVSLVVLSLLYFGHSQTKKDRQLSAILGFENVLLLLFALHGDLAYIKEFGFTQARLYGLFFVGLLTALFLALVYWKKRGWQTRKFLNSAIWIMSGTLLLLNIINVDYLVFHHNPAKLSGKQVDFAYMTRLSADSLAYDELYAYYTQPEVNDPVESLIGYRIKTLQSKYQKLDWRGFSFYEWLASRQVRNLDTSKLQYINYPSSNYPPSESRSIGPAVVP